MSYVLSQLTALLPPVPADNVYLTAALWIGLALIASLISIRIGVSVALVEIVVGMLAGNFLHLQTNVWINFLAGFGSILLTFLAGAEIEPAAFRKHLRANLVLGGVSFLVPFILAMVVAYYVVGWNLQAAQIAGIALSTTSVAVVYAVMVETGLNRTEIGKLILAACFVTDLGTVLALGILFANFNLWLVVFVVVTVATLAVLATIAGSEAVLPAYLVGLVIAGVFMHNRVLVDRMRSIAFALLTPFYLLKAGSLISLPALLTWTSIGLVALFLLTKLIAKVIGVRPLTRPFGLPARVGNYMTLLMATSLTFGSISALYGYTHGYIDQTQYTILVTVVILSAIVPTVIAQSFFRPRVELGEATLGADVGLPAAAENDDDDLTVAREVAGSLDE